MINLERLSAFVVFSECLNFPDDDASDLRLKFTAETRLSMPMARFLSLDVYAQGFALQGRVPDNDDLGFSWTLGSVLDVSGAFEL